MDDLVISALISPQSAHLLDSREHLAQRTAAYMVATDGYRHKPTDMAALHRCITALKVWECDLDAADWAGVARALHSRSLK